MHEWTWLLSYAQIQHMIFCTNWLEISYLTSLRMHFSGPCFRQNFRSWTQYCKLLKVMVGPWFLKFISTSLLSSFITILQRQNCYKKEDRGVCAVGLRKREWGRERERQISLISILKKKIWPLLCLCQMAINLCPVISYVIKV